MSESRMGESRLTLERFMLKGERAEQMRQTAERLGRSPQEVLKEIVDRVLGDGLIDAVLDEGAGR